MRQVWDSFYTFQVLFNEEELSLNVLKPTLSLLIPIWKPFIAVMAAWALLGLSKLTNPKHLLWFVARSMNTWGKKTICGKKKLWSFSLTLELMTFPNGRNICMSSASPNSWKQKTTLETRTHLHPDETIS